MSMSNGLAAEPPYRLSRALARNWWLWLVRGIVAVIFGILAFVMPGITLISLTLLWGAFALIDGVLALAAAIGGRHIGMAPRWWLAVVGIAGLCAGLFTFVWPITTLFVLLILAAAWALAIGVLQVWGAIALRREIQGEWMLVLSGVFAILFAVILVVRPDAGALAIVWVIGAYAVLAGISYIGLALRLRRHHLAAAA